jgi:hypothetical protein
VPGKNIVRPHPERSAGAKDAIDHFFFAAGFAAFFVAFFAVLGAFAAAFASTFFAMATPS